MNKTESMDRKGHKKYPSNIAPPTAQPNITIPSFDIQKLGEDQVNVEQYVKSLLQKLPNEEAVQQLSSQLLDSKDSVSTELQRNVYKNYTEFVVISKEITKLEGDMISVRRILGEWKDVRESWSLLTLDYEPQEEQEEEEIKVDPTEVETRIVLMKSLYREIEGLSKALPDNPNRELVFDGSASTFFEINGDTYKQTQTVSVYVTSDALITTIWKKNVMSGKNRLTIDRIFPITEIGFIDMKDSTELLYAFKIVQGAETYMYKSESLQEKKSLLTIIQSVTSHIVSLKKQELVSKKSQILSPQIKTPVVSPTKKKKTDDLSNGDYMWLLELPDELDVLIAHRDFTQSITMIEKARSLLSQDSPRLQYIRHAIDERITTISRLVSLDLVSPAATQSKIKEDISRLVRLGLGDTARDIYLRTRSRVIRHRLRQLQFSGDVVSFVYDYTLVFFRLLKNTCEWFRDSFHDASMASGFMKWVQTELDTFSRNVLKQIFMQKDFGTITKCVVTCLDLCQEVENVGMDLGHIFESFMNPELEKAIQKHGNDCNDELMILIDKDDWKLLDRDPDLFQDLQKVPSVTRSCQDFYKTLTQFGSDVGVLISFSLYSTIVDAISTFFASYSIGLLQALDRDLELDQLVGIYINTLYIVQHLFPHTKQQLQERFDRIIPELEAQFIDLEMNLARVQTMFYDQMYKRTIEKTFPFAKMDYSDSAQVLDTLMPTTEMIQYVRFLGQLTKDDGIIDSNCIQNIVFRLLDSIESVPTNWTSKTGTQRKFGIGGVQRFILDLTYLQTSFESQLNESTTEKIKELCEKALRMYFVQNKDVTTPLHGNDFYEERVADAIKLYQS